MEVNWINQSAIRWIGFESNWTEMGCTELVCAELVICVKFLRMTFVVKFGILRLN